MSANLRNDAELPFQGDPTDPFSREVYDIVTLASDAPSKPVDARWRIARAVVDGVVEREFFRRVDDPIIGQAIDYLTAWQACDSDADRERLAATMPHLHRARMLHDHADQLTRGILEARLLAGQTLEEAATACDLPLETAVFYEALFFAIIGKLPHRIYIMIEAIGPKYWAGLTVSDHDVIVKKIGFLKGPLMVDLVVRYLRFGWRCPEQLETLARAELVDLQKMISIEAMITSWTSNRKGRRVKALMLLVSGLQPLIDAAPAHTSEALLPSLPESAAGPSDLAPSVEHQASLVQEYDTATAKPREPVKAAA